MAGEALPKLDKLDRASVQRLTETAIEFENLPALMSLAKINKYAVVQKLTMENIQRLGRIAGKGGVITPQLYFITRGLLDPKRKRIFRRLARESLLRMSLRIAGQGLRGDIPKRSEFYEPGMEIDLDATIDLIIEKYVTDIPILSPRDLVYIEKRERKKSGVLILDTSGSMMGERNVNAALTAAVAAYAMRRDKYAVIAFNTKAYVIKDVNEDKDIEDIVDRILDLEAVGYTNIEDALKKGLEQLNKIKGRFKWAILITDGAYNQGRDPRPLCKYFEKLHVINLPGKSWGRRVCQDLARLGGGRYVSVQSYQMVPRVLMRVLHSPW